MAEAVEGSRVRGKRRVCAVFAARRERRSGCCTRAVLLLSDAADHLWLLLVGVLGLHMDPWDLTVQTEAKSIQCAEKAGSVSVSSLSGREKTVNGANKASKDHWSPSVGFSKAH